MISASAQLHEYNPKGIQTKQRLRRRLFSFARFTWSTVGGQKLWLLPNVEDLDLVMSVTKTIFVVPRKNRIRFFDDQTNFVAGSEPVKLIAFQHDVIYYYVLQIVFALANLRDIVLGELVHRSASTAHPRSGTDLFYKRFDYQVLSLGRCHARLRLTSVSQYNCETD